MQKQEARYYLKQKLLNEDRVLLWSYRKDKHLDLPNELVIEKYLNYGVEKDLKLLLAAYPFNSIHRIWSYSILPSSRNYERQILVAKALFNMNAIDAAQYIEKQKKDRIERELAGSY